MTATNTISRRTIADYVSAGGFEPEAPLAMRSLGYRIVHATELRRTPGRSSLPDLRIADDWGLGRIPREANDTIPIVLVTSRSPAERSDRRISAAIPRPATFRGLYTVLQSLLESTPRSSPRIPTGLPGRCSGGDLCSSGAVVSLSENGCLFRSSRWLPLEPEVDLVFSLPGVATIKVRARPAYRNGNDLGLAFQEMPPGSGAAISRYVMDRLRWVDSVQAILAGLPDPPTPRGSGRDPGNPLGTS